MSRKMGCHRVVFLVLLYFVMINDILSSTPVPRNLKYSLFADDCITQIALDFVQQWASLWGFKFSVPKCIGVVFTQHKIPALHITLQGQLIPFKNSMKFLGLHFDSRLNWKTRK